MSLPDLTFSVRCRPYNIRIGDKLTMACEGHELLCRITTSGGETVEMIETRLLPGRTYGVTSTTDRMYLRPEMPPYMGHDYSYEVAANEIAKNLKRLTGFIPWYVGTKCERCSECDNPAHKKNVMMFEFRLDVSGLLRKYPSASRRSKPK